MIRGIMDSLWGNIFKTSQKEKDGIRTILRKIPIFENLGNRELAMVERILHRREYKLDEAIFSEGDPGLGMYIIETGTAEVASGAGKNVLAELHSGEFFGELALLDESARTATVIAKTPCRLLCFFQPDLFDLIERTPRLGVKILFQLARVIGARLKKANEDINELKKGK